MARKVKGPPAGREVWYTPEVDGNAKAPLSDRVRIKICYPTEAQKRWAGRHLKPKGQGPHTLEDIEAAVDNGSHDFNRCLIEACVLEVEGYEDTAGRPITTGAELWEHGEHLFVGDIAAELQAGLALTAQEKKASEAPSESQMTEPPAGTARHAPHGSKSSEDAPPAPQPASH